jgi:hypothetical protein
MVKSHFAIKADPFKWPPVFLKQQLDKIVDDIQICLFEEGSSVFRLNVLGANGPEKDMAKMLSVFPIAKTIVSRRVHYVMDSTIYETSVATMFLIAPISYGTSNIVDLIRI